MSTGTQIDQRLIDENDAIAGLDLVEEGEAGTQVSEPATAALRRVSDNQILRQMPARIHGREPSDDTRERHDGETNALDA